MDSADTVSTRSGFAGPAKAAGAVLLVAGLLVIPGRYPGRIVSVLYDFAHAPVFAALVFVVIRSLGGRRAGWKPAIAVAIGTVMFGALGEVLQHYAGRSARFDDVIANTVGVAIGFVAATWQLIPAVRRRRICVSLLVVTCVAHVSPARMLADIVWQYRQLPLLGSFETELELQRWGVLHGWMQRSTVRATEGTYSLCVELGTSGKYPSCTLQYPPGDWSEYALLEFDVFNDSASPLRLITKIEDFHHDYQYSDRYHKSVVLSPGWTTIRVNLNDVRAAPKTREMDMTLISRLSLFTIEPETPRLLYFDRFVLRRSAGKLAAHVTGRR